MEIVLLLALVLFIAGVRPDWALRFTVWVIQLIVFSKPED